MKNLIEIIKGFFIGVAGILPGVSGGTFSIILGIYGKLIDATANLLKNPIKSIKSIWQYIVGIGFGMIFSILVLSYVLNIYPLQVTTLFIGLILGSIPIMLKEVDIKKIKKKYILAFLISIFFMILIALYDNVQNEQTSSVMNSFSLIISGIIYAITTVVPGISGTVILIGLGYYIPLITMISEFLKNLLTLNIFLAFSQFIVLIPFIFSVIIGFIVVAKIVKLIMKEYKTMFNWIVFGIVVSSPFPVILDLKFFEFTLKNVFSSILTLVIGYLIATLMLKFEKK